MKRRLFIKTVVFVLSFPLFTSIFSKVRAGELEEVLDSVFLVVQYLKDAGYESSTIEDIPACIVPSCQRITFYKKGQTRSLGTRVRVDLYDKPFIVGQGKYLYHIDWVYETKPFVGLAGYYFHDLEELPGILENKLKKIKN